MSDDIHPNSFAAALAANRGLVRLNEVTEARAVSAETALAVEREKVARLVAALTALTGPAAEAVGQLMVHDRAEGKRLLAAIRAAIESVQAQEGEG